MKTMSMRAATAAALATCLALSGCAVWRDLLTPPPPPDPSGPEAYDLGLVPAELGIRWPQRPVLTSEVEIQSDAELNGPWTESHTRIAVVGQIDQLVIDADDVEIEIARRAYVGSLVVLGGHERIHVHGGELGQVVLEPPRELHPPPPEWRVDDMIEDVLLEDLTVDAVPSGLSAVLLRGRRVALINSRIDARMLGVYVGDTAPVQSEDVVIAGCSIRSEGEDVAVAVGHVRRAVVVDSWLENPRMSSLRFNGHSEWVVASRNTLSGGGVMIGTDTGSEVENAWFWANRVHHSAFGMLSLAPDQVDELVVADNVFFSDAVTCAWCADVPESWIVRSNRVRPFEPPPPRP